MNELTAARDIASRVLALRPRWLTAKTLLIAALWNLDSKNEARRVGREMMDRHPSFSIGRWASMLPYRRQEDLDALIEPLRLAGLPE